LELTILGEESNTFFRFYRRVTDDYLYLLVFSHEVILALGRIYFFAFLMDFYCHGGTGTGGGKNLFEFVPVPFFDDG